MNDIMKIVKYLEESGLLIEGVSQTIENKAKEHTGRFIGMLWGTLGASLLRNLWAGKGNFRVGKDIVRACQDI